MFEILLVAFYYVVAFAVMIGGLILMTRIKDGPNRQEPILSEPEYNRAENYGINIGGDE